MERTSQRAMAIVERYEGAINYLYPMLLNMSHKHRVLRDEALRTLLTQLGLFHDAAKSGQASRIYLELLRFRIKWFCQVEMGMNFSHWMIAPITRGLNFLGYRIWHTHKLLRPASVARANTHNLLQRLEVAV